MFSFRRLSLPFFLSVGIHGILIVALFFISGNEVIGLSKQNNVPVQAMILNLTALTSPPSAREAEPPAEAQPHSEPELLPEPLPVPVKIPLPQPKKVKPKLTPIRDKKPKQQRAIEPQVTRSTDNATPISTPHNSTLTQKIPASANVGSTANTEPNILHLSKPIYPERALALNIEGKVNVQFDVNEEGRVVNVRILSAEPKNLFEREVKHAMRKWRYQAKEAKNLSKTILFKIDGSTVLN